MQTIKLPRRVHYGQGIGGLFSRMFSFVKPLISTAVRASKPILKNVLKDAGREGLKVGAEFIGDVLNGKNGKQSLAARSKKGLKRTASKTRGYIKVAAAKKKTIPKRKFARKKSGNKQKNTIFD
jgi:hypothetical protein